METPKEKLTSFTSEELNHMITECCMPFAEIYHEKPSDQLSEEEIAKVNQLVIKGTSDLYFSLYYQKIYSSKKCTNIINRLTETTQKLCKYLNHDFIIRNYAVKKLKVKPYSIEKINDWQFRFFSINDHWILKDTEGKKYHVKTALKILHHLRGSFLNEIFMYKILEYLGFGPRAEAVFIPESNTLYTITQDLNNSSDDSEKDQEIKFVTAQQQKVIECKDEKSLIDLLAVNFIIDFFELQDIYGRETNYGIRKMTNKETKFLVEKPIIIDFHLKATGQRLSNSDIVQKYVHKQPKGGVFLLGLTFSHIDQEKMKTIIKSLEEGSPEDNHVSIQIALEDAFQYTEKIQKEIFLALDHLKLPQEDPKQEKESDGDFEMMKYSMEPIEKLKESYLTKWKQLKISLEKEPI